MNKYSRGKIYRIYAGDKEYIGSTIRPLSERLSDHKSGYKNRSLRCNTKLLFEEYGIENCHIELIEDYPCNNKTELLMRERYWIEQRECINQAYPFRTTKEIYERAIEQRKNRIRWRLTGIGLYGMGL